MTNAVEFLLFLFRLQTEIFANVLIMSSSAPSRLCCYALFILIALCRIFFSLLFLCLHALFCFVLLLALSLHMNYMERFSSYLSDFVWKSKSI